MDKRFHLGMKNFFLVSMINFPGYKDTWHMWHMPDDFEAFSDYLNRIRGWIQHIYQKVDDENIVDPIKDIDKIFDLLREKWPEFNKAVNAAYQEMKKQVEANTEGGHLNPKKE